MGNAVKLTVLFEEPFWIGIFEYMTDGRMQVSKVTFGSEPKDSEIYDFILKNYFRLRQSPAVKAEIKEMPKNPKRIQREAKKQTLNTGIGTKSQQALQLQREEMKTERKTISKEQRLAEKERRFELRQQKQKEKHKGR